MRADVKSRFSRVLPMLLIATALAACVPPSTVGAEVGGQYMITRNELASRPAASVFDVISATRPSWLQPVLGATGAGAAGAATAEVYMDGRPVGPLEVLRTVSAEEAEKLCFFRPTHAQSRFGTRARQAVIEVFTRGSQYSARAC
jgi:hypothetical protein